MSRIRVIKLRFSHNTNCVQRSHLTKKLTLAMLRIGFKIIIMSIDDQLKKLTGKINISEFLLQIRADTTRSSYLLQEILKLQFEILESQRGIVGQELETSVESKTKICLDKISSLVNKDIINSVDFPDD